jgi:hypothetical protein
VPKSINSLIYDPFVNRTKTITMSGGNNMNFSYDGTERRIYKKDVVNSVSTDYHVSSARPYALSPVLSPFFWQRAKRKEQRKALELFRTCARMKVNWTWD